MSLFGQTESKFVFFDACKNQVLELPYELWTGSDSTIQIDVGQTIELEPNYYQLHVQMDWNEKLTGFYFDLIIDQKQRVDTLYLQKSRFYGPTYLHPPPDEFKYYCCDKICDGTIIESDSNGVIRFRGKFKNGIPISNLKYYNKYGKRIRKEVYVNGNLKRIK